MDNTVFRDESRFEIINGETVMMSPRPTVNHNTVTGNIFALFRTYLKGKRCRAFVDGVDVHLDEDNTVIPDAMIVCNKDFIRHDGIYGAPDLVVEVLSPSTATRDKKEKKALYEKHGVKEYWIAEPTSKSLEVYHLIDSRLELDRAYTVYPDWQWTKMTYVEKNETILTFQISLYDDFQIDIRDIFENVD